MQPTLGHPVGTGRPVHVCPVGHSPPQLKKVPPQKTGPEHVHCPLPGSMHACPERHGKPQLPGPHVGIPSVVVVGHTGVVTELVVLVVVAVQQKPTASGVSVASVGRHAARTFTPPLMVPSLRRRAQRTEASALTVRKRSPAVTRIARVLAGMGPSPRPRYRRGRRAVKGEFAPPCGRGALPPRCAGPMRDPLDRLDRAHLVHGFGSPAIADADGTLRLVRGTRRLRLGRATGRRYLDGLASLWNVAVGHGRAEIARAIAAQARALAYAPTLLGFSSEPAVRLAARIARLAPKGLDHVVFTSGGSESNESVIRLVRLYWRLRGAPDKIGIVALNDAYHGSSTGAASLTGLATLPSLLRAADARRARGWRARTATAASSG